MITKLSTQETTEEIFGYKGVKYNVLKGVFFCAPHGKKKIYKLNEKVSQKGKLKVCKNGIHFCKELKNVIIFYNFYPSNFFLKIKVSKGIKFLEDDQKTVASTITPIEILKTSEVLDHLNFLRLYSGKAKIYSKSTSQPIVINGNRYYYYSFETPEVMKNYLEKSKKYKRFTINYTIYHEKLKDVILIK